MGKSKAKFLNLNFISIKLSKDYSCLFVKKNQSFNINGYLIYQVVSGDSSIFGYKSINKSSPVILFSFPTTGTYQVVTGYSNYLDIPNLSKPLLDYTIILIQDLKHILYISNKNDKANNKINFISNNNNSENSVKIPLLTDIKSFLLSDKFKGIFHKFSLISYQIKNIFYFEYLKNILPKFFNATQFQILYNPVLPDKCSSNDKMDNFIFLNSNFNEIFQDTYDSINDDVIINSQVIKGTHKSTSNMEQEDIQIIACKISIPEIEILYEANTKETISKIPNLLITEDTSATQITNDFFHNPFIIPSCENHINSMLQAHCPNYPKFLVCGKLGAGKSTFARYLLNRLTTNFDDNILYTYNYPSNSKIANDMPEKQQNFEGIIWMECDVGQPEYHPPGIISLVLIKRAIIDDNESHCILPSWLNDKSYSKKSNVKVIKSMYYGHNTPSINPIIYIKMIHDLYTYYKEHLFDKYPLIVNTNGWFKGLGIYLLAQIIHTIKPDTVFQVVLADGVALGNENDKSIKDIMSHDRSILTFLRSCARFVLNDGTGLSETTINDWHVDKPFTDYQFIMEKRKSLIQSQDFKKITSIQNRALLIACYFAKLRHPSLIPRKFYTGWMQTIKPIDFAFKQILSISLLPKKCYLTSRSSAENFQLKASIEECLTHKLIGLGYITQTKHDNDDIDNTLSAKIDYQLNANHALVGLGVVKEINFEEQVISIWTPISNDEIDQINYMILGTIELPSEICELNLRSARLEVRLKL
ncbi:polynucleotide 5'-hydroxyl-kinase nol9-like isoform X2 [Gordionus sp. m RMFG-2023]|uniref:polynucleotide 5'-hydroxyl-kinase nol9-like isoform X2 n=1 Tax=Gordionus sp. m RMFG-2023 TaxID=3053472 RepID=UPI0031FDFFE5